MTILRAVRSITDEVCVPKVVDREGRREEVCGAAMRVIARGGPSALTLRSLAEELNGSITLVTHFFANRADLFEAITDDLLSSWDSSEDWQTSDDPTENLFQLLEWMVPLTKQEREREASRIALVSSRTQSPSIDHFYVAMERKNREVLAEAVRPLVPESAIEDAVDALRASTNGLVLSIVEHPKHWTKKRRKQFLRFIMSGVAALGQH